MDTLTITQKACCEAIWRAHETRAYDYTGLGLNYLVKKDPWAAKLAVAEYTRLLPRHREASLTLSEINSHGPLKGGYSSRWTNNYRASQPYDGPSARSRAVDGYDARQREIAARQLLRVSEMQPWPESVSTSSDAKSKEPSVHDDEDQTPTQELAEPGSDARQDDQKKLVGDGCRDDGANGVDDGQKG